MKVVGFTFIRNAIKYDYPIEEAINSILPLCDEFIVAVGKSEDDTRSLIEGIHPQKIKIIDTQWDDSLREGGKVLAVETDKAFQAIAEDADWCFYIQGDEVIHEKYHDTIRDNMVKYASNREVEGLLFKYLHFYGSYDYIGIATGWYRNEIRIVKNQKDIFSYKDAQGFRKKPNEKLRVKKMDAYVYHYGWVKDPRAMQQKQETFNKLWHDDNWVNENVAKAEEFDYSQIDALTPFNGTHPKVMDKRIQKMNWKFNHDISFNRLKFKDKLKLMCERILGFIPGEYKNYKEI